MADDALTFHKMARSASSAATAAGTLVLAAGQGRNYLTIKNTHGSATLYAGSLNTTAAAAFTFDIAAGATQALHGFQGQLYLAGSVATTNYVLVVGWSRGDTPVQ